jgi:hypothetical protein
MGTHGANAKKIVPVVVLDKAVNAKEYRGKGRGQRSTRRTKMRKLEDCGYCYRGEKTDNPNDICKKCWDEMHATDSAHTYGEGKPSELKVMKSAAGWYIGRSYMEWGSPLPYSRDSVEYFGSEEQANNALATGNWTRREGP